ncbi:hypothetical protein AcW1_004905 [Taiwanofungus camphoratus]|nr:hypothetical protein AcV7_002958 [Antrodia cinnamomea]KAI0960378.1 hypothetical protein AcW1_004905 [Antrodia cinnamomea]
MNYLRGAVNAISAPYQYYKDINPSTLTGAIDVIVVKRPKQLVDLPESNDSSKGDNTTDENELVCSPFHVRFGKWQVLRPGDKKVNVFVNGNPIPFPMKIGEAGEAFFVFETDEDVSDDLVTSPLLEATKPGQTNADVQRTGRFGAKEGPGDAEQQGAAQEPDFLDLDATASPEELTLPPDSVPDTKTQPSGLSLTKPLPEGEGVTPSSLLSRTAQLGKAVISAAAEMEKSQRDRMKDKTMKEAVSELEDDEQTFLQNKPGAAPNTAKDTTKNYLESKGDEMLPEVRDLDAQGPGVVYTDDMVFDMEGYHSHQRSPSSGKSPSRNAGRPSSPKASTPINTPGPSRSPSPSPSQDSSAPVPFPSMRATSEPPPELTTSLTPTYPSRFPPGTPPSRSPLKSRIQATRAKIGPHASIPTLHMPTETAEYMWDWGSFPQKTPVRTVFGPVDGAVAGQSRKGKERMVDAEGQGGTDDALVRQVITNVSKDEDTRYGTGGRLAVSWRDPTQFRVYIEGRMLEFELSIVPGVGGKTRGKGPLGGQDEVEDAQRFEERKLDFAQFMKDEQVVMNPNLVLRWAGDMYITRKDGSPLMGALVIWRESALRDKFLESQSRSPSPTSDDDRSRLKNIEEEAYSSDERRNPKRISTDLSDAAFSNGADTSIDQTTPTPRPSSSSWTRWWSRSRRAETAPRPDLRSMNTAPSTVIPRTDSAMEHGPSPVKRSSSVASAPAVPTLSKLPETPVSDLLPSEDQKKVYRKRFAKTLRLTSDQLKSLDLKPGANSITFSLSATGAVACTARLFVWDCTDSVVISDIDGTITKSDALGHVFTMIGRDWTHLGVAKLYTDICRNGYKVLYLTSRAIGQADSTRDYLKGIKQNDYQLPEGPVIMSPDRLMASLHREVIMRKPEVFKMACLRDIQKLFGGPSRNPFYAGFGNRITDAMSYRSVNVPSSKIFTIDSTGEVKMELLELAGYKSSYIHMTDLVDQMFPPINRKWTAEYTDFNYWKPPMQDFLLPDLTPPSPALSARSDMSNQSTLARLRNFSLVGSRQTNNMKQFSLPPLAIEASQDRSRSIERRNETHLRQMSSFERLSNTLSGLTRSSSSTAGSPGSSTPTYIGSGSEDEEDDVDPERHKRRQRRSSMPGSLPGSAGYGSDDDLHFGVNDEDDEDGRGYEGENEEEAAAEAFDEDLLATGEMESVPFL